MPLCIPWRIPPPRGVGYSFDPEIALPALIGHPLVFLEKSPQTPVEIVAGEPELLVEQQGDYLFIHFTQDIGEGKVVVWQETLTRFKVIRIDDNHRRIAGITGRKGLRVPISASSQVLAAIGRIGSFMTVHSSVGVDIGSQNVESVAADPTIHLHFIPYGSGFRLEMFVKPFTDGGPYLKPGVGVANLLADVNGRPLADPAQSAGWKRKRPAKSRRAVPSWTWPLTWKREMCGNGTCSTRRSVSRPCSNLRRFGTRWCWNGRRVANCPCAARPASTS